MQHRNTLTRARRIIEARNADPATAADVEQAIALALLGPDTSARDMDVRPQTYPQYGYLSSMAATEAFALELQRGLVSLAPNIDVKPPKAGKYSPLHATPTLFKETWRARQVVDECGVPYWFYIEYAVLRWHELGNKRMPRPSQITTPDMAVHVMQLWADPAYRWNYPIFDGWDERFDADHYDGDAIQDRALDLIDQLVADAEALGHDPAAALVPFLDAYISEDEAVRRFGAELVGKAMELDAIAVGEDIERNGMGPEAALAKMITEL